MFPALIAGLPVKSAIVWVVPPLFANAPSFGSSIGIAEPHSLELAFLEVNWILLPPFVTASVQLCFTFQLLPPLLAVLLATIEFFRVRVAPGKMPPPYHEAVLLAIVLLVIVV